MSDHRYKPVSFKPQAGDTDVIARIQAYLLRSGERGSNAGVSAAIRFALRHTADCAEREERSRAGQPAQPQREDRP